MKSSSNDRVRLSIDVDKALKVEFLKLAKINNTDANKLIRAYIQKYVLKHKEEIKNEV